MENIIEQNVVEEYVPEMVEQEFLDNKLVEDKFDVCKVINLDFDTYYGKQKEDVQTNSNIKNLVLYKRGYELFKHVILVFQLPPFSEPLTEKDMTEEFESYQQSGNVFCYTEGLESLSINCCIDGIQHNHPVEFPEGSKIAYISGMATLNKARGKGYAGKLLDAAIKFYKENGYDYMYLRTNLENSMSEGIAVKKGFEIVKKDGQIVTEEVTFTRINEIEPTSDTRKFLALDLHNVELEEKPKTLVK